MRHIRATTRAPLLVLALVVSLMGAGSAPGQQGRGAAPEPQRVILTDPSSIGLVLTLRLDNGDVISGVLLEVVEGRTRIDNAILGTISIPIARIRSVSLFDAPGAVGDRSPSPPEPPEEADSLYAPPLPGAPLEPRATPDTEAPAGSPSAERGPPAPAGAPGEDVVAVRREPDTAGKPKASAEWNRRFELGLDGSQGNSTRLNIRSGLRLDRLTKAMKTRLSANYILNTAENERVTNRLTANLRNDWVIAQSRFSYFLQVGGELNEFRSFDFRMTGGGGLSARFIDRATTKLGARLGAGFARDFGGETDSLNPELITSLEFEHKLTPRQRIEISAELYPDLAALGEFRSVVRPAWELKLDDQTNLSLRVGLEHRYESNTNLDKESDLDYFATVVWTF